MSLKLKILEVLEEQMAVKFTGKVNILSKFNRQFLGHLLLKDGHVVKVQFESYKGLKALFHILLQEYSLQAYEYIVEPEIVNLTHASENLDINLLKNKIPYMLQQHKESLKFRPPDNVKLVINPSVLSDSYPVTDQEFSVLETLAEHQRAFDIYQHCSLLDFEITSSLVSLRKKGALKILGIQNEG